MGEPRRHPAHDARFESPTSRGTWCSRVRHLHGGHAPALSRYARTGVIDVIRADYVRTARAKGLAEPVVIVKHAARNGMIPILTLLASLLPVLVGGSVVIEVIFNIPGMGLYLFEGINSATTTA